MSSRSFVTTSEQQRDALLKILNVLADTTASAEKLVEVASLPLCIDAWLIQIETEDFTSEDHAISRAIGAAASNVCGVLKMVAEIVNLPEFPVIPKSSDLGASDEHLKISSSRNSIHHPRFITLDQNDEKGVSVLLGFLFHIINDYGDDRSTNSVNITDIAEISVPFLYTLNPPVNSQACRCLSQAAGLTKYRVPTAVIDLLRSMVSCVFFEDGSGPLASELTIKEYLDAVPGGATYEKLRSIFARYQAANGFDKNVDQLTLRETVFKFSEHRLALSIHEHPEWRAPLLSCQAYAQAAVMIMLGPIGFHCAVLKKAPRAHMALLDLCRQPILEGHSLVKTSVIEAATMSLSFAKDLSRSTVIHQWKLSPLLATLFTKNVDESYFHQLCDLSSFMPVSVRTSLMPAAIELANNPSITPANQLRLLTTAIRGYDPAKISFRNIAKIFTNLLEGINAGLVRQRCEPVEIYDGFSARLMIIIDGMDCDGGVASEWGRIVLNSQLPEICTSIFDDPELLKKSSIPSVLMVIDLLKRLIDGDEVRHHLLLERGILSSLLKGGRFLVQNSPHNPFLWRLIYPLVKFITKSVQEIEKPGSSCVTPTNKVQYEFLWNDVILALDLALPAGPSKVSCSYHTKDFGEMSVIKYRTKTELSQSIYWTETSIDVAGKLLGLIPDNYRGFIRTLAERVLDSACILPFDCHRLSRLMSLLKDDTKFWRNIVAPQAMIATSPSLFDTLLTLDYSIPQPLNDELLTNLLSPVAIDGYLYPLAKALFICLRYDTEANDKMVFEKFLTDVPLKVLAQTVFEAERMSIYLCAIRDNFTRAAENLDLYLVLSWCKEWLALTVKDKTDDLLSVNLRYLKTWINVFVTRQLDLPIPQDDKYCSELQQIFDGVITLMKSLALKSNFTNSGGHVWDSVKKIMSPNIIPHSVQKLLKSQVLLFLEFLSDNCGMTVIRHPLLDSFQISPKEVFKSLVVPDRLNVFMKSDPRTVIEYWGDLSLTEVENEEFVLFVIEQISRLNDAFPECSDEVSTKLEIKFWLRILRGVMLKDDIRSTMNIYPVYLKNFNSLLQRLFRGLLAGGRSTSPDFFVIWRDLWLIANVTLKLQSQPSSLISDRAELPLIEDQTNFIDFWLSKRFLCDTESEDYSNWEFCDLASFIWIHSFFCVRNEEYNEKAVSTKALQCFLRSNVQNFSLEETQTIGRMISDIFSLRSENIRETTLSLYNSSTRYFPYTNRSLEGITNIARDSYSDPRSALFATLQDTLPQSMAYVGDGESSGAKLYPQHVIKKALLLLNPSVKTILPIGDEQEIHVQPVLSTMESFITQAMESYRSSPHTSTQAILSVACLTQCAQNSFLAREIIVRDHQSMIHDCLINFGIDSLHSLDDSANFNDAFASREFILTLMELSGDERHTKRARQSLERAISIILDIISEVLAEDVPKIAISNQEKACALWGQCACIVNSFVSSLDSNPDAKIWARETAQHDETYFPFQFVLLQEKKIIELLTSTTNLFDFSARYFYPFRLEYLGLIETYTLNACYVYEVIKAGDSTDEDGLENTGSAETDEEIFASNTSLSGDASDILDDSVVSESILRHQNRIRSSQRNVFRNSVLGEYESNSSNLDEDNGYDSIEELSEMSGDEEDDEDQVLDDNNGSSSTHSGTESIAVDPYSEQSIDEEDESMMSDDSVGNHHAPHHSRSPSFANDFEIEVIFSDEDSMLDYSDWSDEQLSSGPDTNPSENESDLSDIEIIQDDDVIDFDAASLPALFEEGGELMLLYGDRAALEAVEDLGEESDEPRYGDPHSDKTWQDYVDSALGSQPIENAFEDTWRQPRPPISLWDMEIDGALACKDEFFNFVNHQVADVIPKPSVVLDNRKQQEELEMMVSSPEFSLLGRKRKLNRSFAQENSSQAVYTVMKFLFTYLSFRDSEFSSIKAYFKGLVAQGTGDSVLDLLFSSLFSSAKGGADKVYHDLSHRSLGENFDHGKGVEALPRNIPIVSSPAYFCGNVLKLLNFLFSTPSSNGTDSFLAKIVELSARIWKSYHTELLDLLGTPIIAQNRQLLQQLARLIDSITGLLPENALLCEEFNGNILLRLVQVLASEESTSTVFGSITTLFRSQLKNIDLTPYIVKEIKKSANNLGALLLKFGEGHLPEIDAQLAVCNALVPAAVKILRLLSVIEELCDESTVLTMLKKSEFLPLWQQILDLLSPISKVQIVGSVTSLALLEIIAIPASVILKNRHPCVNTDTNGDAAVAQKELQSFASQASKFLCQRLETHKAFINEMLKAKPKLCAGPLGKLAIGYEILNLEGKETILTSKLNELKDEYGYSNTLRLDIDRFNVFDTSLEAINNLSSDEIRMSIQIAFDNEIGEDAGGVAREWLEILSREITDPKRHLFVTSKGSLLQHIDPSSSSVKNYPDIFKFVGRIIGRAIFDRRVINLHFNRAIYRFLKGSDVCLQDMEAVDLEYQRSLEWALNNDITDVLFETFSVENDKIDGQKDIFDLIPNGRNIPVTEENKHDYVKRVVTYKLVDGVRTQLEALRSGFYEIIPASIIDIFDAHELELLITGTPKIDIEDWRRHTTYVGYTSLSPQAKWFWLSVKSFNDEQRAKLLQFSTGTSRVPSRGFGNLESVTNNKGFVIERERGDTNRLPTAHTCMNQITIPCYESYKKLRSQLLLAISEGFEGFGFA